MRNLIRDLAAGTFKEGMFYTPLSPEDNIACDFTPMRISKITQSQELIQMTSYKLHITDVCLSVLKLHTL